MSAVPLIVTRMTGDSASYRSGVQAEGQRLGMQSGNLALTPEKYRILLPNAPRRGTCCGLTESRSGFCYSSLHIVVSAKVAQDMCRGMFSDCNLF